MDTYLLTKEQIAYENFSKKIINELKTNRHLEGIKKIINSNLKAITKKAAKDLEPQEFDLLCSYVIANIFYIGTHKDIAKSFIRMEFALDNKYYHLITQHWKDQSRNLALLFIKGYYFQDKNL